MTMLLRTYISIPFFEIGIKRSNEDKTLKWGIKRVNGDKTLKLNKTLELEQNDEIGTER